MNSSTQAGGASNISGVLYQTLWCLLRALKIRIRTTGIVDSSEPLLVLEPKGGGGDLRMTGEITEVEQLKAKADSGTWSLQTVICDVLPDLFLAVEASSKPTRFRFVTEGTMGRWHEVYQFFRRLGNAEPPGDILASLDDERPLKFQTARRNDPESSKPFFASPTYTERGLFVLIARELESRAAIADMKLDEASLHRRLWRLLGAFEFVGNQTREIVKHEIDQLLLAVVDRKEQLPTIRDALALSLLRKAAGGNVEISAETLLAEQGLKATPLTDWSSLRARSQEELQRRLQFCRYSADLDVRKAALESLARTWRDSARALVIPGESGQGKTWALAGLATSAAADDAPVVWVDATGDASRDLATAADQFWLDIRNGDSSIPLGRIAARLDAVVPSDSRQRLRVCIDNVLDYNEAVSIIRDGWPSRGISIALSCSNEIASSLKQAFEDSPDEFACEDFSWEELHDLLERRLGPAWTAIPDDVRETLRRPLLASKYCDDLFGAQWRPTNEYELYAMLWQRLSTRHQTAAPLDAVLVESLAERVLRGEPYPWTLRQLYDVGVDNESLQRLERCGWLVRTDGDRVRIFHDRLLNWAGAESLCSLIRSGQRSLADVIVQVGEINKGDGRVGNVFLGYVPMDVLWLLTGDSNLSKEAGAKLLAALEVGYGNHHELLYRDSVPTLGERVADALFERYRTTEQFPWVRQAIADAIVKIASNRIAEFAGPLLSNDDPRQQRLGLKLLRKTSCPQLLDQIWQLHARGLLDAKPFLEEHEQDWMFRDDSWNALRRSAVSDPAWIIRTIERADPVAEPIYDLGWLIANLPAGSEAWQKSKTRLFSAVTPDKHRVLSKCIGLFRDSEQISWLEDRVSDGHHMCPPVALQALSRIVPDRAVELLRQSDPRELQFTSQWSFSEVWHRRPSATNQQMVTWAKTIEDPWQVGFLYQNRVSDVPNELFAILLGRLEEQLSKNNAESGNGNLDSLYRELSFIAKAVAPDQLDAIQAKRATPFELHLSAYLRKIGPQRGMSRDSVTRNPGLAVLRRVNGQGFTNVINDFLSCDDRFGRRDATEWAMKRPDDETFRIASDLVLSRDLWGDYPLEQIEAMKLLAAHERWEGVTKGLVLWGFQAGLTNERLVSRDYSSPWVDELRLTLKQKPTPGTVLAVGFCGTDTDIEPIHQLLESSSRESEIAHACVIALELLGDKSIRGISLVAEQLAIEKHHYSAHRMLTYAGTSEAWQALLNNLAIRFDHITALNLVNLSDHSDEAVKLIVSRLPSQKEFGDWGLLRILVLRMRPEFKQRILADRWIREKLHREAVATEGSFWLTGSKSGAIECLAELDRDAAFQAALRALQTPRCHDRERYPYILMDIDADRAIPLLIEQLNTEQAGEVRHSIGRALAKAQLSAMLRARFDSEDFRTRVSACFAAGWADDGLKMIDLLQRSLDDLNERVIEAAMSAIDASVRSWWREQRKPPISN